MVLPENDVFLSFRFEKLQLLSIEDWNLNRRVNGLMIVKSMPESFDEINFTWFRRVSVKFARLRLHESKVHLMKAELEKMLPVRSQFLNVHEVNVVSVMDWL